VARSQCHPYGGARFFTRSSRGPFRRGPAPDLRPTAQPAPGVMVAAARRQRRYPSDHRVPATGSGHNLARRRLRGRWPGISAAGQWAGGSGDGGVRHQDRPGEGEGAVGAASSQPRPSAASSRRRHTFIATPACPTDLISHYGHAAKRSSRRFMRFSHFRARSVPFWVTKRMKRGLDRLKGIIDVRDKWFRRSSRAGSAA
jgi:hypothetical protein